MGCSAQYLALVKTKGGLTPEDPYSVSSFWGVEIDLANPSAYGEWRQLAQVLADKLYERLDELGQVETVKGNGSFPRWNELQPKAAAIWNAANNLPSGLGALVDTKWWEENIGDAEQIAIDAACLMERIDYAMLSYEVTPPPLPGLGGAVPPPSRPPGLGFINTILVVGVVGLVGVGAFYAIRASRRAALPEAEAA